MDDHQVNQAAESLRSEYDAMPGLQLTFWQARRLLNLPDTLCDRALAQLLDRGYLIRARDGRFRRASPHRLVRVTRPTAHQAV